MTHKDVALYYHSKFDLNNVPTICHYKSIKESFTSFSSAKNICYIAKIMLLDIQYSLDLYHSFPNVSIMY